MERVILSGTPEEGTLRLYEPDPERVISFLGLYRSSSGGILECAFSGRMPGCHPGQRRGNVLVQNAEFTRKWLGQLPQGFAEMIAHLNGERLFRGNR